MEISIKFPFKIYFNQVNSFFIMQNHGIRYLSIQACSQEFLRVGEVSKN